jgi:hypothetical protein
MAACFNFMLFLPECMLMPAMLHPNAREFQSEFDERHRKPCKAQLYPCLAQGDCTASAKQIGDE